MNDLELGYTAGIIDGEGWIHLKKERNYSKTGRLYPQLGVESSDYDVISRLKDFTGVGRVYGRKLKRNNKQTWVWRVQRRNDVVAVLTVIYPIVCKRRQEKIEQAIKACDDRERTGGIHAGSTFIQA